MILHVDMDAFYASVEERDDPGLAGKPVVVGGSPTGRGVVAAANYAAREYGVHSAMPAARARQLCPHAIFLPSRIGYYAQISACIRGVFERYTPLVEPLSLDEAFLDVSGCERLFGAADDIAISIKRQIREEVGLVASVGVAPNKFLAKLASDLEKPDGLVVVDPAAVQAFLDPLPVERLWGVGRATHGVLERLGIRRIGELRRLPQDSLAAHLGRSGEHLWRLAHGVDERRVVPDGRAKSISHETTFERDIGDRGALRAWLLQLTENVARRLRRHHLVARTVEIKLRYADFDTHTRSQTLAAGTDATRRLWQAAAVLLDRQLAARRAPVRLLGMGASGLAAPGPEQDDLFEAAAARRERRIDSVQDAVVRRFGADALRRGGGSGR